MLAKGYRAQVAQCVEEIPANEQSISNSSRLLSTGDLQSNSYFLFIVFFCMMVKKAVDRLRRQIPFFYFV